MMTKVYISSSMSMCKGAISSNKSSQKNTNNKSNSKNGSSNKKK